MQPTPVKSMRAIVTPPRPPAAAGGPAPPPTPPPRRSARAPPAPSVASRGRRTSPTRTPGATRARRCAVSPFGGLLLGYDDEHLGAREERQAVLEGHVLVPGRHNCDAGRATQDGDLTVPAGKITADPRPGPAAAPP